MYSWL